jgi:hypothetical protein
VSNLDDVHLDRYPDRGHVRRELYVWNEHEPDRYSDEAVRYLNDQMVKVAPKLEVKVVELPDLREDAQK